MSGDESVRMAPCTGYAGDTFAVSDMCSGLCDLKLLDGVLVSVDLADASSFSFVAV